ncbi:hypothetical protein [Aureivirga sp. CE67]|uniref:hypothetical protein n=1 Tax=Aureivirga sp. CE67 TaxID=1788983 RepID=UPI0018C9550C|nr:hypothetical protein [Aureivirga sp. CE67]
MKELFEEFIKTFIKADKQERLLGFLKKEKNWRKLENEFHTSAIFKNNVLINIKPSEQHSEPIYSTMKKMGAEDECYSLMDFLRNEQYDWNLKNKLDNSVGFLIETVIYCPNSRIGYFEGGHATERYLLREK